MATETSLVAAVPTRKLERWNMRKDSKKTVSVMKAPTLSMFAVPSANHCSRYSGLFRCSVIAKGDQFIMYYDGQERPVLRADKQLTFKLLPKYYIFDISRVEGGCAIPLDKDSPPYVGKIRRDKNVDIHAFSLHPKRDSIHSQQSLYIHYEISSSDWMNIFSGNEPPRKVRVAIYHKENDSLSRGNTLAEAVSLSMKETHSLSRVADSNSGLHVFSHKDPCKNECGDYALNFFGRCQLPSSANMQLQDENGRVILQLAQSKDYAFNLDFR